MGYATRATIDARVTQAELIRITDETGSGAVDDTKITSAMEAADLEIDSYLGNRYTLPLEDPHPLLSSLAADLALWNLYSIADADGMPKTRQDRHDRAIRLLEGVAAGTVSLGEGDPDQVAPSFSASERVTGRERMKGIL